MSLILIVSCPASDGGAPEARRSPAALKRFGQEAVCALTVNVKPMSRHAISKAD
jgi:hypothetical protein